MSNSGQTLSFFDEPVGVSFIEAVRTTIEMYFGHQPEMTKPVMGVGKALKVPYDVAGVMSFTSLEVDGQMLIAFRKEIILKIYESMLGEKETELSPAVQDCVRELANTIYGLAKAPLADKGYKFPMALPEVFLDVNSHLDQYKSLELPFKFDHDKEIALILVVKRIVSKAA